MLQHEGHRLAAMGDAQLFEDMLVVAAHRVQRDVHQFGDPLVIHPLHHPGQYFLFPLAQRIPISLCVTGRAVAPGQRE